MQAGVDGRQNNSANVSQCKPGRRAFVRVRGEELGEILIRYRGARSPRFKRPSRAAPFEISNELVISQEPPAIGCGLERRSGSEGVRGR